MITTPYDTIKIGQTVKIQPRNNYSDKKDLIWFNVYSAEVVDKFDNPILIGSSYVKNIFTDDQIRKDENNTFLELTGIIEDIKFLEKSNGGRSNEKEYSSVQDYFNDPKVKRNIEQKCKAGVLSFISGDPDKVSIKTKIKLNIVPEQLIVVELGVYDDFVPPEWYNEFHADILDRLLTKEHYASSSEAINGLTYHEDLFGDRYFPVIKASIDKIEQMKILASEFKNWSKPLFNDQFVFIGLRAKPDEIYTIEDIYNAGGYILKNVDWDW